MIEAICPLEETASDSFPCSCGAAGWPAWRHLLLDCWQNHNAHAQCNRVTSAHGRQMVLSMFLSSSSRGLHLLPLWQEEVGGPGLIDEDWDAGTSGERLHTALEYHSASKLAPNFSSTFTYWVKDCSYPYLIGIRPTMNTVEGCNTWQLLNTLYGPIFA